MLCLSKLYLLEKSIWSKKRKQHFFGDFYDYKNTKLCFSATFVKQKLIYNYYRHLMYTVIEAAHPGLQTLVYCLTLSCVDSKHDAYTHWPITACSRYSIAVIYMAHCLHYLYTSQTTNLYYNTFMHNEVNIGWECSFKGRQQVFL